MLRNKNCTTQNLLDYLHHQRYCKIIGIDLSRETNTIIPEQINFEGKSEKEDVVTMFFITEKQQKTIQNFSSDSLIVTE